MSSWGDSEWAEIQENWHWKRVSIISQSLFTCIGVTLTMSKFQLSCVRYPDIISLLQVRVGLLLQSDVQRTKRVCASKTILFLCMLCIHNQEHFNVLLLLRPMLSCFKNTCWWWQCWAPLRIAPSTSTWLCFGCSRQTRPVPGVRSAPPLVQSPCVSDRYGGPPSRAWRRHVWWTGGKQNRGGSFNIWLLRLSRQWNNKRKSRWTHTARISLQTADVFVFVRSRRNSNCHNDSLSLFQSLPQNTLLELPLSVYSLEALKVEVERGTEVTGSCCLLQ